MIDSLLRNLISESNPSAVIRTVRVPQPAAGADWSFTIPGGSVMHVRAIRAALVTSAVVANRRPVLTITDGNDTVAEVSVASSFTATQTASQSWLINVGAQLAGLGGNGNYAPLPDLWLPAGSVVSVVTAGIDAGDQWSAIRLWVWDFLTQPFDKAYQTEQGYLARALGNNGEGGQ